MCQLCVAHGLNFHELTDSGVDSVGGFPTGFSNAAGGPTFADYVTTGWRWSDGGSVSGGTTTALGGAGGTVGWSVTGAGLADATGASFFTGSTVSLGSFLPFDYQAVLKSAFDAWAAAANIDFVQVADGGGNIGTGPFPTIRISGGYIDGQSGSNVLARGFFPNPGFAAAGDVVFDSGNTTFYSTPKYFFLTALHEIGHALGLNHENVSLAIMNPFINTSLSGLQTDDVNGIRAVYGAAVGHDAKFYLPSTQANLTELSGVSTGGGSLWHNVYGNALDNVITTSGWALQLYGYDGNDTLDNGTGALGGEMYGGTGSDTYIFNTAADWAIENPNEGSDTILSTVSVDLARFPNVENVTLTGNATVDALGNTLNNVLIGNAAANRLDGGQGIDAMAGGAGDDTYSVDNINDVIAETPNQGTDTVTVWELPSYALPVNFENLNYRFTSYYKPPGSPAKTFTGIGNSLDNRFTGTDEDDTFDGGLGADYMDGSTGNDTYVVDNIGDVVNENGGTAEGTDTVLSSISYTLPSDVEKLTLAGTANLNGTGNGNGKTLTGNSGNNVLTVNGNWSALNGGGGSDTLRATGDWNVVTANSTGTVMSAAGSWNTLNGGAGNDTLWVTGGGSNTLTGGAGTDTLDYFSVSAAVTLDLAGSVSVAGSANSTFTGIENFVLGSGDDRAIGASGTHYLDGGPGADTLDYSAASVTITLDIANGRATYGSVLDDTFVNFEVFKTNNADDMFVGAAGTHTFDGGGGTNTVVYSGHTVNVNLLSGVAANNGFNARDSLSGFQNATVTSDGAVLHAGSSSGLLDLHGSYGTLVGQTSDTLHATGDWNTLTAGGMGSALAVGGSFNKLYGGPGDDTLWANGNFNILDGGAGSSTITVAGDWNQLISGNVGSLMAATGSWNTLHGGAGDDVLSAGGGGSNTIDGDGGLDTLDLSQFSVTPVDLDLQAGLVTSNTGLDSFSNIEIFRLGAGNDRLAGGAGYHTIDGGGGTNTVVYSGGLVNVNLLTGVAVNNGFDGQDALSNIQNATVTAGGAVLHAGSSAGVLALHGNFGSVTGQTTDTLQSVGDWNTLVAGSGNSVLAAIGNWNTLTGGSGNDTLTVGGGGSNTLDGRGGTDTLTAGGAGKATYVYGDGYGNDTITDFMAGREHYIDFHGVAAFHATADVLAQASQVGADVVIANGGGSLTLQQTTVAYLTAHQDHLLF